MSFNNQEPRAPPPVGINPYSYDLFGAYRKIRILGRGSFGIVYEAKSKIDESMGNDTSYAIKMIEPHRKLCAEYEVSFYEKLKVLDPEKKSLCIHLIANFVAADSRSYLIFPKLEDSLYGFQKNRGVLNQNQFRHIMDQILSAVSFLHGNRIAHGDLKTDNILLLDSTTIPFGFGRKKQLRKTDIKLIDFGLYVNTRAEPTGKGIIQNFHYRAPEVYLDLIYNHEAVDMWSIGIIMFKLYTEVDLLQNGPEDYNLSILENILGKFPRRLIDRSPLKDEYFDRDGYVMVANERSVFKNDRNSVEKWPVEFVHSQERELYHLMKKLLELDPDKRYTAKRALNHPFIKPEPDESESYCRTLI